MASTDPDKRAQADRRAARAARSSPRSGSTSGPSCSRSSRRTRSATRRCSCTTTGWSRSSRRTCRWTRWSRSCSAPTAARSRTRRPTSTRSTTDTLQLTENVAQVFMGMRIQCAQCHNHPFDRWTQNDYYGFAAFFSQIGRKQGEDYRETIVFNSGGGEVTHPVGGRVMKPKFLGGDDARRRPARTAAWSWPSGSPRRENPCFATSFANRVWAHFFGIGHRRAGRRLPRVSNPASNPELLAALGKRFTDSKYDLKTLVRDICNSRTYQRSTQRNDVATRPTSGTSPTPTSAGSRPRTCSTRSAQVTETKDKFPGLPLGARAVQIADGGASTYFLTTFGRATRETVCSCEVKMEPTLSQALHLLNGDTANAKIQQGGVDHEAARRPGSSPRSGSSSSTSAASRRKPTREELDKLLPALRRGLEPGAGPRGHLLGPAEQPRIPVQSLIRTDRRRRARPDPAIDRRCRPCPHADQRPSAHPRPATMPSSIAAVALRRPASRRRRPGGRRQGQAEGHLPGPGLGDLPEPLQQLPQRRQAEGRPEPRDLRHRDAGRRLGQGHRAGRPRRRARSCSSSRTRTSRRCRRTRPRSPTPSSTLIKAWIEGGAPETSGSVVGGEGEAEVRVQARPLGDGQAGRPARDARGRLDRAGRRQRRGRTPSSRWPPARGRRWSPSAGTSRSCSTTRSRHRLRRRPARSPRGRSTSSSSAATAPCCWPAAAAAASRAWRSSGT